MTGRGTWIGATLRVLGLVVAAVGVMQGGWWAGVAALGAVLFAFGLTVHSLVRLWQSDLPRARPVDFSLTIDLLRRAHGAVAGWAVGLREGEVVVPGGGAIPAGSRPRGAALVQLASVDGRSHVAREAPGTYVAVGDFPYGAGLLLSQRDATPEIAEAAIDDLRRLVAGMRLAELEVPEGSGEFVAKQLAMVASGVQTLDGVARAGAELAQQLAQRGAVIAVQDPVNLAVTIRAVSSAADKRLLDVALQADAPVTRAVNQGIPLVTQGAEDIFGPGVPERRRRDRAGTAYPLVDGHFAVGALVLLGASIGPEGPLAEQVGRLVVELGPRLAAARAVQEAERRATSDPLTGLCNRREFERVIDRFRLETQNKPEPATLLYADLDHFKQLNDTLGHAAGDAALRHVATVLQAQLRDGDLVARIGGEEFAVWLPRTPLREGLEVAERIRRSIEGSVWQWNGTPRRITTSCGIAAYPETVGDLNNLRSAADAGLYRAKQAGRNRVEMTGSAR
jgi:diguanylate cyclase (GGDEF)-like protein